MKNRHVSVVMQGEAYRVALSEPSGTLLHARVFRTAEQATRIASAVRSRLAAGGDVDLRFWLPESAPSSREELWTLLDPADRPV
jgi:hypothetical protein